MSLEGRIIIIKHYYSYSIGCNTVLTEIFSSSFFMCTFPPPQKQKRRDSPSPSSLHIVGYCTVLCICKLSSWGK